jgi:hypothetical protein
MANESSSSTQLRRFGLTVGGGLALVGALSWYRGHTYVPAGLWTIAAALVLLGLTSPRLLRPVERWWSGLATVLGWVNTRIILSLLFYAVFAPVGLVCGGAGRTLYEEET